MLELFFQALYHNTEVLLFLLLTDKVRGAGTAVYARGVLGSMTFYQLSILLVTVTLGPFAYVRSYPIYSMLAAAELSVVTRLDIINLLVWILVAFVRGCSLSLLHGGLCATSGARTAPESRRCPGWDLA